jgi:hypothetical protein
MRVVVTPPVPGMAGHGVEVPPIVLDVLAMVAFGPGEPERPLLEDRVIPVPERQRQAQPLLGVAEPGQSVLTPAVPCERAWSCGGYPTPHRQRCSPPYGSPLTFTGTGHRRHDWPALRRRCARPIRCRSAPRALAVPSWSDALAACAIAGGPPVDGEAMWCWCWKERRQVVSTVAGCDRTTRRRLGQHLCPVRRHRRGDPSGVDYDELTPELIGLIG